MRRVVVKPLALFLVLTGVSLGLGQPQAPKDSAKPAKSKLEEMLAEALKNNPDIRVAVAKAAEAEAELNRTRLQVTQKVVTLYYAIETQKTTITLTEKKVKRVEMLVKTATVSSEELEEARQTLTLAKAKLTELEAQLPALLGKTSYNLDFDGADDATLRFWLRSSYKPRPDDAKKATGPTTDKLRKALETPIKVNYKEMSFSDVLNELQKAVPGLSFNDANPNSGALLTLRFAEALPVSSILQAVGDQTGVRFFVREYGILAAVNGPPGALTVQEFMRQKPTEESVHHNPPPENVDGVVKKVDSSGLVVISIGSDAGLTKGHTLELYRLLEHPSKSKYLGTIRILEAKPKEAVAQPVGRMTESPHVGDRVASRIVGK